LCCFGEALRQLLVFVQSDRVVVEVVVVGVEVEAVEVVEMVGVFD